MSSHFTPFTLKDISRPGGGFAMLAVDQREAMRLMLRQQGSQNPSPTVYSPILKLPRPESFLLMLLPFWRINNFVLNK